jgi:phage FluMu protein Com
VPYCPNCKNANEFIYECHTHELVTFDDLGRISTQQVLASTTLKVKCYRCNSEELDGSQEPEGERVLD